MPTDVLRHTLQFFDKESKVVARFVCKRLKGLIPPNANDAHGFCQSVAQSGNLSVLHWAWKKGAPCSDKTLKNAAEPARLKLWSNFSTDFASFLPAAKRCEVMLWEIERSILTPRSLVCDIAAKYGPLDLLIAVRAKNIDWEKSVCVDAAERGHLDILKWAFTNWAPWSKRICTRAAENGHLEVLKWATAQGNPWDKRKCINAAAANGHLEVLRWLLGGQSKRDENNCRWDLEIVALSANKGHLHILQWARDTGVTWEKCIYL